MRFLVAIILFATITESVRSQTRDTLTKPSAFQDLLFESDLFSHLSDVSSTDISFEQLQYVADRLDRLSSLTSMRPLTASELLDIPGVSRLDVRNIVRNTKQARDASDLLEPPTHLEIRTRVIDEPWLSNSTNYADGYYHGSALKTATTVSAKSDEVELDLVEAKDPGEPLFFDRFGAAVSIRKPIELADSMFTLRHLVLGDYSLGFGNGLAFSKGAPQIPSLTTLSNPLSKEDGIKPYRSVSSLRYFEGAATEFGIGKHARLDLFGSDRRIDAEIDSGTITYLPQTGYHRTALELSRRNTAQQQLAGGALSYVSDNSAAPLLDAGVVGYTMSLDHPVHLTDSSTFRFQGQHLSLVSAFVKTTLTNVAIDAEYAEMLNMKSAGGAASVTVLADPLDNLRVTANYHSIPSGFYSPFGGTFGLYSDIAENEQGFIAGAIWKVTDRLNIFGYVASASNRLYPNTDSAIVHSDETKFGVLYTGSRVQGSINIRMLDRNDGVTKTEPSFDIVSRITSRIEVLLSGRYLTLHDSAASTSWTFGAGTRFQPLTSLRLTLMIEPYRTSSFASRLFSNEPDLPGNVTLTPLYGNGTRYKAMASYEGIAWCTVRFLFAESFFTYPAYTPFVSRTTFGAQVDMKF